MNYGQWHHICVQHKGVEGFIYIEAVLGQVETGSVIVDLNPGIDVGIGADIYNLTNYFKAAIDDLYIYNSTLDENALSESAQ